MKTFKLQVVIGNQLIVVEGATGYKIMDAASPPKVKKRAPVGGKTILLHESEQENVSLVIHEVKDPS